MLRPLYLDLFDVLLPLATGLAALIAGRYLQRMPVAIFHGVIALCVLVVLGLGLAYFTPLRDRVGALLWHVGGESPLACAAALLLLGVVWSTPRRATSTGFLRALVALVALILVLTSGGRLWWRFVNQTAWHNAVDAAGCLRQSTGWTCSPAAATMLLHRHGIDSTEGEMAYLAGTSYLGTDVPSMAQALTTKAQPYRLTAQALTLTYEACVEREGPLLACVNIPGLGGHAVLVLRAGPADAEVVDPRFGHRQTIARDEMERQWDGKVIYLSRVH